jgi:hypothetical protein
MREMRAANEEAYLYLLKISPRHWSKSRFSFQPKCDAVTNNMSETFNSVIVEAREKPIVTMLNEIRTYLMDTWNDKREDSKSLEPGSVMPKIKKTLRKRAEETRWWLPR